MDKITKILLRSFLTNITLSIIKIIAGFIGASGALVADGVHSLSDTITDVFAIAGNKLSTKPADYKHPFGHGKIEYVTCIIIGLVVLVMGLTIIYNAIFDSKTIPSFLLVIASLFVICAKLILSRYLLKKGEEYDSNILVASGSESFSDVISSVIVLVSILLAQLGNIFIYADMIAMIIIGLFIVRIAFDILKENFSSLLGERITNKNYISEIKKVIKSEEEVKRIDSLIILKYGQIHQMTCEVSMDENMVLKDAHMVLDRIEKNLKKYDAKIKHINIHVNPYKS